jgi:hypothetical protein
LACFHCGYFLQMNDFHFVPKKIKNNSNQVIYILVRWNPFENGIRPIIFLGHFVSRVRG